ncbi:MAG TPA: PilZ domain-containing protein [Terracidiphilus sp.]|nr:PilZ domain-containing protein [Terracidiphilus sp.]
MSTQPESASIRESMPPLPVEAQPVDEPTHEGRSGEKSTCDRAPANAGGPDNLLPWVVRSLPKEELELAAQKRAADSKSWLRRWLNPDPPDPRRAPRLRLPWIDAYFFTGGKPEPHRIRDISATGVYVMAEDRWYMGTVVRITLVDRRLPIKDRSLTVHAKVVRWGNDGTAFQYVLEDENESRRRTTTADVPIAGIGRIQAESFLERVMSPA